MSARSRKTVCLQNGAPPGGRRWLWLVVGVSGVLTAQAANADPQVVLPNGLPVQVKPTYSEPGLPAFSFPTAGGSLLGWSGSADTGNGSGDGSTSSGGGSTAGSGDAYNTMMAQSWGSAAANAAGAIGVSATALAATCAMGFQLSECGSDGRRQCVWRVPDDQLDLCCGHQWRRGLRPGNFRKHCVGVAGADGPDNGGLCGVVRVAHGRVGA